MKIINKKLEELIPYINNPRNNENAIDKVASSIKEFGFKVPIVIDKDNIIVTGHTRLLASRKLGLEEVPCVVADDLTEAQIKAFRIADNKVSEFAEWDMDMLAVEMEELKELDFDIELTGFDLDEVCEVEDNEIGNGGCGNGEENKYTNKIEIPYYEPTGDKPDITELVNEEKTLSLIKKIKASKVDKEIKDFLIKASQRHLAFNYENVAEYYAHSEKEVQELFEESALVIIDLEKAIRNGYVEMREEIENMLEGEEVEE